MSSFRVEAEFGDPSVAGAVLGRIVSILGSRVALPIDRLSDALLVSDAVIAATRGATPRARRGRPRAEAARALDRPAASRCGGQTA